MQINTLRLRAMLGWLGMLLPFIVLIMSVLYGYKFPDSISTTYYIPTCITPFMIILGSSAILLISYKGYDKTDDIVCTLAGIFALGICLFSCIGGVKPDDIVGTFQIPARISGWIHNVCAVLFFALLSFNSLFLFTKSSGVKTRKKKIRNAIYIVCGIGMILSLLLIIPVMKNNIYGGIWGVETLALLFFGISWLTKSDIYPWLFCDTPYEE